MVRAALRRLAVAVLLSVGVTAAVSLVIGVVVGSSVDRSLVLGFYLMGCFLMVAGFFLGNRGPARPQGEGWSAFSLQRWVRWATPEEQRESLSLSALLVILGFVLILLGAVADTRHALI